MGEQEFDKLLESMPRIAEAINAFTSEDVQRQAFEALVGTLNLPSTGIVDAYQGLTTEENDSAVITAEGDDSSKFVTDSIEPARESNVTERRRRKAKSKRNWAAVKDIGFRPEGKTSFKDFIEEKQPKTIDEKGLLAVYYFEQILELEEIGVGHVMAAYKEAAWRNPANPENSLQAASSRHHWLDTSNMRIIKTTQRGRDFVEHDMPGKK
ncbi:hypothetical protein [Streptomyces misionensis]|uniref:hypothetical protein n=1 Tax=Streptomyces misionensis TaxID=67331 RepID=UPI0033A271C0